MEAVVTYFKAIRRHLPNRIEDNRYPGKKFQTRISRIRSGRSLCFLIHKQVLKGKIMKITVFWDNAKGNLVDTDVSG